MTNSLRPMNVMDGDDVLSVYAEGIATGHATFQEHVPSWAQWDAKHLTDCRLVAEIDGATVGFAALAAVSARPVYRGVAEVSIYVAAAARGHGIGRKLLVALIEQSEACGLWTLQAGIFPENLASLALHRSCGFRDVGRRQRLGCMSHGAMAGQWRDIVLLERRSAIAGIT